VRTRHVAPAAALLALVAAVALWAWLPSALRGAAPVAATHSASHGLGLSALPLTAQGVASSTVAASNPAYRIGHSAGGLRADNPAQRLEAGFHASGVDVRAGATRVHLALQGVGWGARLRPVAAAQPGAAANRVSYRRNGVVESYANGPLGLEQSFTVAAAPSGRSHGRLTLSIGLAGNAGATLARGGQSIDFVHAGGPALRYTGLAVTDARGRALPSSMRLSGGAILLAVDVRGARFPLKVDPFMQQGKKLTGGEETGAGELGVGAALSSDGNTAIVGGPSDNGSVGAAWVFTRSGSTWTQQGPKLTGSGETGKGRFGFRVALSNDGNTALIGGPVDNSLVGAVWVFIRTGTTWEQQGEKLTAGGEETGKGEFGVGVALSGDGNTALIGASSDKAGLGAAWAFIRSGTTWEHQGPKLTGSETLEGSHFGFSVALSEKGDTGFIGGGGDNEGVGAVWAFVRSGTTWEQQGPKLTGTGEVGPGHLGFSVALSAAGSTALAGGVGDNGEVGAAWVFVRSGTTWSQQGAKLTGTEESGHAVFGSRVALSSDGNTALIGGPLDSEGVGAAWVFGREGTTWKQTGGKLTVEEETGKGQFGASVALSGDAQTALGGAPADNAGVGAAWALADVPLVPSVVTKPATAVTGTTATLNATVNPQGSNVSDCHFNYGPTTSYGSTAPCSSLPGSGFAPVPVSAAITGLSGGATYHFQIVATNGNGTGEGGDQTFTTPSPPEFGRCLKVAKGVKGKFSNASCTASATEKAFAYEWSAGPGPNTKFTLAFKELTAIKLETTTKKLISCTGATGSGEYTGSKTVGSVVLKLTGCALAGVKCTSGGGAAEGELVTATLSGALGIEKKSTLGPAKDKVAWDLAPAVEGTPFLTYTCGETSASVRGSVIGPVVTSKMATKPLLKWVQAAGKEHPESFEGQPKDILETQFGGEGPFVQTGLGLVAIGTNEESIEINPVV
jgi:hypothetical protein